VRGLGARRCGGTVRGPGWGVGHHASTARCGALHVVDEYAAATAVLVAELLARLGVPLDADLATCLYVGLVSDTGSFRYAGTTPEGHPLAGRLLATGIRPDLISPRLFGHRPYRGRGR